MIELKFGKHKGKTVSQCPTEYLDWLMKNTDVHDAQWGKKNQELVNECQQVIASRSTSVTTTRPPAFNPGITATQAAHMTMPALTYEAVEELRAEIEAIYASAQRMNEKLGKFSFDKNSHQPF